DAVPGAAELSRAAQWDAPDAEHDDRADTLFDLDVGPQRDDLREVLAELDRQDAALSAAADHARMRVLLAADSAGALVAAEARAAGVPWSAERHAEILDEVLGPRGPGGVPARMTALAARVREA